ncbi:MAG: hypothetical protein MUD12_05655 [Spirochaetes bacterium]|jgi:hypothetical protein|nr:hypothetical protein [Spirochaetota bacterium]
MKPKKSTTLTKKFIFTISAVFSILILAASISVHLSMKRCSSILIDSLLETNGDAMMKKTDMIIAQLESDRADTAREIKASMLKSHFSKGIVAAVIYVKTQDENFFRILDFVKMDEAPDLGIELNTTVKENKDTNFLKKALLGKTAEPRIYEKDGMYWQSIYAPYRLKKGNAVIQLMLSAESPALVVAGFEKSLKGIRIFMVVLAIALVIAVLILAGIFIQNYSMLINNLSSYMQKAADGELNINLGSSGDKELNQLALSFNSLMEELKDKNEKAAVDPESSLFNLGVQLLKENRVEDSISVFKTLIITRPDSFGSYFNLGVGFAKIGDYHSSASMFEKAAAINPSDELTSRYLEKIRSNLAGNETTG